MNASVLLPGFIPYPVYSAQRHKCGFNSDAALSLSGDGEKGDYAIVSGPPPASATTRSIQIRFCDMKLRTEQPRLSKNVQLHHFFNSCDMMKFKSTCEIAFRGC